MLLFECATIEFDKYINCIINQVYSIPTLQHQIKSYKTYWTLTHPSSYNIKTIIMTEVQVTEVFNISKVD